MSEWYRTAVFYEALVRSFRDSNGDGIGDLCGLTESLDYLQWLGIDCIWLPPIFESPLRDAGYDVSDFYSIQPDLGTIDDLRELIDQAHFRGLRIVSDLVMNHTSDAHDWFRRARQPGSQYRDWYVWSDTPDLYPEARIIFLDTEDSNWTWDETAGAYYWHRFYSHQPDLNFDNPDVRTAVLDVVRHWLGFGFDGFRLDAVPYLFERVGTNGENLPETHDFLKEIRALVDSEFPDAVLLSEANQWPQDAVAYFGDGDECHMNFHFPLMPRLYMALARGHADDIRSIMADTPDPPAGAQWAVFLRNHDELTLEMVTEEEREFMWGHYAPDPQMRLNQGIRRRMAPLLDGDRRSLELLHGLLLSLPGSPVLYYGDEIGMGDDYLLDDRDGVRTPMQWNGEAGAGFSTTDPKSFWLPLVTTEGYRPQDVNVADQKAEPGSFLNWLRTMLETRRSRPEMGLGSFEILDAAEPAILAFVRELDDRMTLVIANFERETRRARITGPRLNGRVAIDITTGHPLSEVSSDPFEIDLGALEFRWLEMA
ncbi:MAG: maltose alpha-D-glucosyltransferase [Acidobacteria bacterium]|nr:maltose alpha-D-glucosyltransferase [Acidobacteriota bacterium]